MRSPFVTEANLAALERLQPRPSEIPQELRDAISRLEAAVETRRERVRAELVSLRPKRDALRVAGFSVAAPSDDAYEDYVRNVFRDQLTGDLDECARDLRERVDAVQEHLEGVQELYRTLERRLKEHATWSGFDARARDVEGFIQENSRSYPDDIALDSDARFRAAHSGRSVAEEFVRAMLKRRISREYDYTPEDAFRTYEDIFAELKETVETMLPKRDRDVDPFGGGVDTVTVRTQSFFTALQRARTAPIAFTPDARLEAEYADGEVQLPIGKVFDPFAESAAVLNLTWTREGEVLATLFQDMGRLAKQYRIAADDFERLRLLKKLADEGAHARELGARARDAQQLADDETTVHNNVWSPEALETQERLEKEARSALEAYDDHGIYVLDPLRRKIESDPRTMDVPHAVLDAYAQGRQPEPRDNTSVLGSDAYLRGYVEKAHRLRAAAEDAEASMTPDKQLHVYPSLIVRMLTHMAAIAASTFYILGSSRPPEGMVLELVYRFAQSPLMQELNVLGAAAETIYVQKSGEWAFEHARAGTPTLHEWERIQLIGARLTRQVEQAENETAIVHFSNAYSGMTRGVSAVADAMLSRSRRSAARRLSLARR